MPGTTAEHNGGSTPGSMPHMPTDYVAGYGRAQLINPDMASNYVAHTLIGDPVAEEAAYDLLEFEQQEAAGLIESGMNGDYAALVAAPESLRRFFEDADIEPDWLDRSAFRPGVRLFHQNSYTVLAAFVSGVLVEGFITNIAKSFMLTGRVRDSGVRRLGQNNRHMTEIFLPGGMDRQGDGWKLTLRIRIIHAQLRHLLSASEEWDADAWGTPISAAHLGFAISAFSARLLKHMKTLGVSYTDEEHKSFMDVWRYAGHVMGIPETILFRDAREALELYDVGLECEPAPSIESIMMAHSLVNSTPLVVGVDSPSERQKFARHVYRVSRELIGNVTADALQFPKMSTLGVARWMRWQANLDRALDKAFPARRKRKTFQRFGVLLESSTFDEDKISYRLPDHVYAEESSEW